jgi:aspartyl-tRNA(Asn)/glutamyl-tRNA(Gln) amidotransferase subunit B
MEEGSLRVDANVSVRQGPDAPFGTRCEIKNMNSLRSLGRAIEYEARRQIELLTAGESIVQETRHWSEDEGRTSSMRSKEEAFDYRYFPEPDLVPVAPDDDWKAAVRSGLPVLPAERRASLAGAAGVAPADVALLVELDLDAFVLEAIEAGADARIALNRAANEVAGALKTQAAGGEAADAVASGGDGGSARVGISASSFASLVQLEAGGQLTATQSKQVLAAMLAGEGDDPAAIAKARGFEAMDTSAREATVDEVIAANAESFEKFKGGDQKVSGMLIGQVMKKTQGKADGKAVTAILRQRAGL